MKQIGFNFFIVMVILIGSFKPGYAESVSSLLNQVEALQLTRQGYTLCGSLSPEQLEFAKNHPLESTVPGTYRFGDDSLVVVADAKTHRVLVLVEHYEPATQNDVQMVVSDLIMVFHEPTLSAHDKLIYWLYGSDGKFSSLDFETSKKNRKPLSILASVKLNSEINIMKTDEGPSSGKAYCIISSEPVLQRITQAEQ